MGRCRQHSTQQARPPTAGQGPLPLAGPCAPGTPSAPGSPPHSGLSCVKDRGFVTWGEVLAQGLDLQGRPVPCCPWHFVQVLTLRFSCVFSSPLQNRELYG